MLAAVESDNPERFLPGSELLLAGRKARISKAQQHRSGRILYFEGIDDRDRAEALRGSVLEVDRTAVPPAEEGSYWFFELTGCRCRDRRAGDLGEVVDVLEDGGGLILLARRTAEDGVHEVPIPFVRRYLSRVDIEAGEIEVDLPPGLIEICESVS